MVFANGTRAAKAKGKKMTRLLLLFIVTCFVFACNCGEEPLRRVCDQKLLDHYCSIEDNNIAFLSSDYQVYSACVAGITQCNSNGEVVCVGYEGPQEEVCDGLDNNCDGNIDEGFDEDGDGLTTCNGDCDDLNPQVFMGNEEICDGFDNDCNGQVDDLPPVDCWTGPDNAVFEGSSACMKGLSYCEEGNWSECRDQRLPELEMCDLIDNNCDGLVDNNVFTNGMLCGPSTNLGACSYGGQICIDGESFCADPLPVLTQLEVCDNIDNDCDGSVDEDISRPCSTACGDGFEYCEEGGWVGCTARQPSLEICDGVDNDCDGTIDEDCPCNEGHVAVCYESIVDDFGQLVDCGFGLTECTPEREWGPCVFVGTQQETCDGFDNDCDGVVDGMVSDCGETDVGQCQLGTSVCTAGEWGECEGAILPDSEICDGLDNDCDGDIDEDLDPNEKVDMVFALDVSVSMHNKIEALISAMASYASDFVDSEHQFGLVIFPINNDINNNMLVVGPNSLSGVQEFAAKLSNLGMYSGVHEPSIDVVQLLVSPDDPFDIGWRADATPYVILITDEDLASFDNNDEHSISVFSSNCQIGNCQFGDVVELFAILPSTYFLEFDDAVYGDLNRLYDVRPPNTNRYVSILRSIFTNVCVDGTSAE